MGQEEGPVLNLPSSEESIHVVSDRLTNLVAPAIMSPVL